MTSICISEQQWSRASLVISITVEPRGTNLVPPSSNLYKPIHQFLLIWVGRHGKSYVFKHLTKGFSWHQPLWSFFFSHHHALTAVHTLVPKILCRWKHQQLVPCCLDCTVVLSSLDFTDRAKIALLCYLVAWWPKQIFLWKTSPHKQAWVA